MIYKDIIIGYYEHSIHIDEEGPFSDTSFIRIRQDFQGKGLCYYLAKFTYCNAWNVLGVNRIYTTITAEYYRGACRCYFKAAFDCGFKIYQEEYQITSSDWCYQEESEIYQLVFFIFYAIRKEHYKYFVPIHY